MLIAFTGRAGSGKSTAAKFLQNEYNFTIHKFAGPLKNMCRALGMTEAMIEGDQKELPQGLLCGKSPRFVMQTIGTNWGRNIIGNDLWVNAWLANMPSGNVVVDDCRFTNEYDAIKTLGGKVVEIVRDIDEITENCHESEIGLDGLPKDMLIVNDGDIKSLCFKISGFVEGTK